MGRLLALALLIAGIPPVGAETHWLQGQVRDARSGVPLPAANILVVGSTRGTISNADGTFHISLQPPVKIRISFIGYDSQTLAIESIPREKLEVRLSPAAIDLGEMTITAQNPAVQIMEKALAHKQRMREKIQSFSAQAYHRLNVQNDSAVVLLIENRSRLYWQAGRGSREIFGQLSQTNNIPALRQGVGVSDIPNFYDDDILIGRFKFIGPTHPKLFDFYHLSLTDRRAMDGRIIYEIHLQPKTALQPLFEGDISIQDSSFALIAVDLASAVLPRQNLLQHYRVQLMQQFREVVPGVWLPADWHEKGTLHVGMTGLQFPAIHYVRLASLTDYQLNVPVPDSLWRLEKRQAPHDSTLLLAERGVPLSLEETWAYKNIDSTMTITRAFKPRGILSKIVQFDVRANDQSPGKGDSMHAKPRWQFQHQPMLWFNRVEAFHLGWNGRLTRKPWEIAGHAAYRTGLKNWSHQGILSHRNAWRGLEIAYADETRPVAAVSHYPLLINSLPVLFGFRDYYDYYQARGWRAGFDLTDKKRPLTGKFAIQREEHDAVEKRSDFDLAGNDTPQRSNPAISAGVVTALTARIDWGLAEPALFGRANGLRCEYERGLQDVCGGQFDYHLCRVTASARLSTFQRRQPVPNAFDLHFMAGTESGRVPWQKSSGLPGSLGAWSPFGSFHTVRGGSLYAQQYVALFWEHNFRALPFDLLGWRFPGEQGLNLLLHGGHGHISRKHSAGALTEYHELGLSLSGLFSYLRLDVSRRLGKPGFWCVGLSVAKFI